MIPEYPDISCFGSRGFRDSRNDLIVGICLPLQNYIDLTGREAGQGHIHIDIKGGEVREFQLEDFHIPSGIERDLVIREPQRPLLRIRKPC